MEIYGNVVKKNYRVLTENLILKENFLSGMWKSFPEEIDI